MHNRNTNKQNHQADIRTPKSYQNKQCKLCICINNHKHNIIGVPISFFFSLIDQIMKILLDYFIENMKILKNSLNYKFFKMLNKTVTLKW